jgi:hypothetical protein
LDKENASRIIDTMMTLLIIIEFFKVMILFPCSSSENMIFWFYAAAFRAYLGALTDISGKGRGWGNN